MTRRSSDRVDPLGSTAATDSTGPTDPAAVGAGGRSAGDAGPAEVFEVTTPVGAARVTVRRATAVPARAWFVASHGAGGGIEARDLAALAAALPARGIHVALVEQPWRVAGRRLAPAPGTLDAGWLPVLAEIARRNAVEGLPVFGSGRSAGARVACRTAGETNVAGVVALAFPLHPPGRPERSRLAELLGAGVPTLVVQGERDSFGGPDEFPEDGPTLLRVPFADHGFAVPKRAAITQEAALALITAGVGDWLVAASARE
ncbi:alpha/beta family hydrolase [Embleya sp. NPDC059259]|uniref:alpha/beta hydrolase family protein n=1 Tax=unclassified Embleya TaxID=2699296 RepID=UPI00369C4732